MTSVEKEELSLRVEGHRLAAGNVRPKRKRLNSGSQRMNNKSSRSRRTKCLHGLMRDLKKCNGISGVLTIHATHNGNLSCQDLSNCWNRIVKILREKPRSERSVRENGLDLLLKDTMSNLESFKPTPLSATAHSIANVSTLAKWSAGKQVWDAFQQKSQQVVGEMCPRSLANMAWAAATAGFGSMSFFEDIAKEATPQLDKFNPKDLGIIAWSFARARYFLKPFFQEIAETATPQLGDFDSQSLSNFACAYATASFCPKVLFRKIAMVAVAQLKKFNPLSLANLAWAFATAGYHSFDLFAGIADVTVGRLGDFEPKSLANIAWSYAVLDHASKELFGSKSRFIGVCNSNANRFSITSLRQLHQWQLWSQERNNSLELSRELRKKCFEAFKDEGCNPSQMQKRVAATLTALDLQPEQEVTTGIGYSIDAVVQYRGRKVGIEVDGPSHFINRTPNGATQLKRRQLLKLEGNCCLMSVPHWEWRSLATADRRRKYLMESLDRAIAGSEALSAHLDLNQ